MTAGYYLGGYCLVATAQGCDGDESSDELVGASPKESWPVGRWWNSSDPLGPARDPTPAR